MNEIKSLVSVVFPTMDRKEYLISCIKSIKKSTYKKHEIVIADNGSTDGSFETVKKMFPDVVVLRSDLNLGYPAAVNRCIRKSKGEFILRLDDDVVIDPDTIEKMLNVLKSNPKIGAVNCLNMSMEHPDVLRSTGLEFNMFTGKTKILDAGKKYHGQYDDKIIFRDLVGGGCLLLRKRLCKKIGFCNEEYFLSYEDIDFCFRIRKAGYKIAVVGSTKMYHSELGGKSLNEDWFRVYFKERGRALIMKKFGGWKNFVFLPYLFLILIPLKGGWLMAKGNTKSAKATILGIIDGLFRERTFVYTKDRKPISLA